MPSPDRKVEGYFVAFYAIEVAKLSPAQNSAECAKNAVLLKLHIINLSVGRPEVVEHGLFFA